MSKAVVFDMDGTLVNSREMILAAYAHVARTHGLPAPAEANILAHMGKSMKDIMQSLFPGVDVEPLLETNGKYVRTNPATLYAGVLDLLQELRDGGWKLAVVTGGNKAVQHHLDEHGMASYFSSVVHTDRIKTHKPDPEGVLLALKEIGVDPSNAIMVGDMDYDILAGKNAGIKTTIGLTHGFGSRKDLESAGADQIFDNILEVRNYLLGKDNG
jgi:pyrophosphatase PpaX